MSYQRLLKRFILNELRSRRETKRNYQNLLIHCKVRCWQPDGTLVIYVFPQNLNYLHLDYNMNLKPVE